MLDMVMSLFPSMMEALACIIEQSYPVTEKLHLSIQHKLRRWRKQSEAKRPRKNLGTTSSLAVFTEGQWNFNDTAKLSVCWYVQLTPGRNLMVRTPLICTRHTHVRPISSYSQHGWVARVFRTCSPATLLYCRLCELHAVNLVYMLFPFIVQSCASTQLAVNISLRMTSQA